MSMMVPSPNGLLLGASTMAFGSVVNVLRELMQTPFNWEFERDRSQFISLNCAFYDLRQELTASDFFKIKDEQIHEKIEFGQKTISNLQAVQERNDREREAFIAIVENLRNDYVKKVLGESLILRVFMA